jgi:peroxiredoxin
VSGAGPSSIAEAVRQAMELDAPLEQRLAIIRQAYRSERSPFMAAVDRLVARLEAAAAGEAAPKPGEAMPPFLLPDETGHLVALQDLLRQGPVAIAFLRGHWCPYCRLNSVALQEVEAELAAAGGRLVVITPERRSYATRLKQESEAGFPVLTDMDNGYALSLNLAIWVGEEMQALMLENGRDLPDYQGNTGWMLPIPATFVVAPDGTVAARHVDPDYRRRMDVGELVAAIRRAAATRAGDAGYAAE